MARQRAQPRFDPYAILKAIEGERVGYVIVGAFARVLVGAEELTHGIDLTPATNPENLRRLDLALEQINAGRAGSGGEPALEATDYEREPVIELETDHGAVKIIPYPAGTRGYEDLRRAAERLPIGQGLRPSVASPGDLARMLHGLGREQDILKLSMMRRLIELEHGLHRGLSLEL